MNFENIPHEMRMYEQWLVWRYEDGENGSKPTKVPYSAKTGTLASVTDSKTWATYEEAVAAVKSTNWYSGIGFVLTQKDPYTIIDLDNPYEKKYDGTPKYSNPDEILNRQLKVFKEFDSYAERSVSETGLHIIIKGKVPSGRRRSAIEVYSQERYMIMTGNIFRQANIIPMQDTLDQLYEQMGGNTNGVNPYQGYDTEQKEEDAVIVQRALSAANGDKFKILHEGRWQEYYQSQSEADFAYVDMIAFYTQNREQITRMFLACPLGQREKAKRTDYMKYMLNKCFDRMLPPIDVDGLRNMINEKIAVIRSAPVEAKAPPPEDTQRKDVYTFPPGLVGELAHFIYKAAPRPVPEIALAGAIGLMCGIIGRSYNVNNSGLNLYVLLLAPTGTGKEAISSGIDKLVKAVKRQVPNIDEFIGPGEINSAQALIKYIDKASPSFVSIVGEFGIFLSQLAGEQINHLTGLKKILLDLFHKSGAGQILRPMIYSDKEKNTNPVEAPAVSILGESTPETFYSVLNEDMITNGLLPRFLTIEYYGKRPPSNDESGDVYPDFKLCDSLATIAAHSLQLNSQNTKIEVALTPAAFKMMKEFDVYCDLNINSTEQGLRKQLWNRGHLKALRLAAVVAVGLNSINPCIDVDCADWAIRIVVSDIRNFLGRFEAGEIGIMNDENKQLAKIADIVRNYILSPWSEIEQYKSGTPQLHAEKFIPYSYIHKRAMQLKEFKKDKLGATAAVKRALKTYLERGDIQEVGRQLLQSAYNTTAVCYMIKNSRIVGL